MCSIEMLALTVYACVAIHNFIQENERRCRSAVDLRPADDIDDFYADLGERNLHHGGNMRSALSNKMFEQYRELVLDLHRRPEAVGVAVNAAAYVVPDYHDDDMEPGDGAADVYDDAVAEEESDSDHGKYPDPNCIIYH